MTSLNPDWKKDARLGLQIEDSMKTAMFSPQQPRITNGEAHVPPTLSVSVSELAQSVHYNFKFLMPINKKINDSIRSRNHPTQRCPRFHTVLDGQVIFSSASSSHRVPARFTYSQALLV
jgi:hypothetical protein